MKGLKLAGLAVLGMCTVSVPVTLAVVLSATGSSDVLVLGDIRPAQAARDAGARRGGDALRGHAGLLRPHVRGRSLPDARRRGSSTALRRANAVATFFDIGQRGRRPAGPRRAAARRRPGRQPQLHPPAVAQGSRRRGGYRSCRRRRRSSTTPTSSSARPMGRGRPRSRRTCRQTGLTSVYWTVAPEDAAARCPWRSSSARCACSPAGSSGSTTGSSRQSRPCRHRRWLRRRGMCPGFLAATPWSRRQRVSARTAVAFAPVSRRPSRARRPQHGGSSADPRPRRGGGDRRGDGVRRGADACTDRRIVVSDNSTDRTVELARSPSRLGGVGDRRQHRQEGRRAQPGVERLEPELTDARLRRDDGRGHDPRPALRRVRAREVPGAAGQGPPARRRLRELHRACRSTPPSARCR